MNTINSDTKSDDKEETLEAIIRCIPILEKIVDSSELLEHLPETERIALITAAGKISRPDRKEIKKRNKERKRQKHEAIAAKERRLRAATGIRKAREASVYTAPLKISLADNKPDNEDPAQTLKTPRNCYVCKAEFINLHHFYDTMCPECAELNYQKRFQTASLKGQVALITGSRLKIGYQATLMMLRAGARVIATTRFPNDSAIRFSGEPDFPDWGDRLQVYGLDLRHTPSVELFTDYIKDTYQRLDILINNAAQTVRRPPGFYAHLMENETKALAELPIDTRTILGQYQTCISRLEHGRVESTDKKNALSVTWDGTAPGVGLRMSARLSQIPYSYDHSLNVPEVFPAEKLDADLQQVDLRKTNSWRLRLGEIQTSEMLEIQLVNSIAPFVLCNRLADLMKKDYTGQKHIVNVSAMEGKFLRFKKGSRHPHTNMAKASLNMLTHTSASDLAKYGIFMNAVDTGWVTDEDPAVLARLKQKRHDFQPPLDIVDGAARVCDPFFHGIITEKHWCGKFLKDYFPIDW
ncbi:MAG: SDR family oxidoreductase [Desulfobacterales bacterium]|jgi:NAD(P)-dependent dehydrogenase (short-subunit alcohol dehydrogenase family)|nr:SDR family oxidoreductase [Desulfobacteraceae bacterium]MBT7085716.1 SDR family oxidoreductase [Desulfobacterales bacterium]MBT7698161.1 SDR family oxidoreductase [Desulfobacterales bacterium]